MGVKGLWKILEPSGRRVPLESLNGLVLAVDVSIWLNQAIKSAGDNWAASNAHLLLLFHRVCKLLYYHIRPVFVFDGPSPLLKLRTLQARRKGRQEASKKASSLLGRHTMKVLEAHALMEFTGTPHLTVTPAKSRRGDVDMFHLPQIPADALPEEPVPTSEHDEQNDELLLEHAQMVVKLDVNSSYFKSLPPEVQHDLLIEKKEMVKHTYTPVDCLPKKADDFSDFQVQRLLQRRGLSRKLEDVRTTLNTDCTAAYGLFEASVGEVEGSRIASSDTGHYILIRTKESLPSSQDASSSDQDRPVSPTAEERTRGMVDTQVVQGGGFIPEDDDQVPLMPPTTVSLESSDEEVEFREARFSPSSLETGSREQSTSDKDMRLLGCTSEQTEVVTHSKQYMPLSSNDVEFEQPVSISLYEEPKAPSPVNVVVDEMDSASDAWEDKSDRKSVEPQIVSAPNTVTSQPPPSPSPSPSPPRSTQSPPPTLNDAFQPTSSNSLAVEDDPELQEAVEEVQELYQLSGEEAQRVLREEIASLGEQVGQQEKRAAQVSDWMYQDAQELLSLFGVPFVVSPSEAEAQCAALELLSLIDGSITDDNDVFLFGGQKVYRHFFDQKKDIEFYSASEVEKMLGLDRDKLIVLAYLLGSDYTEGLEGIGHVYAMEALRDFGGEGIETLKNLKQWWIGCRENPQSVTSGNALQKKLRQLNIPGGFPDEDVWSAYIRPVVDSSGEKFEWGMPDLDLLREFAQQKFGWNVGKANGVLLPVMKSMRSNSAQSTQRSITSYMSLQPHEEHSHLGIMKSKRMQRVVASLTGQVSDSVSQQDELSAPRKRKRGVQGRGRGRRGGRGRGRGRGKGKEEHDEASDMEEVQPKKLRKRRCQKESTGVPTVSTQAVAVLSASSSSSDDNDQGTAYS